ncbi:hypothetical protein Gpo141_00002898 [Globisporangium polare]
MAKRGNASTSASAAHAATAKKRKSASQVRSRAAATTRAADRKEQEREDHDAAAQRHLAQRFKQAARVREKSHTVLVQLRRQRHHVAVLLAPPIASAKKKPNNTLSNRLRVLMEMAAQLRIHLLQQAAHLEPIAVRKVHRRLDVMSVRAARIKEMARRVRFLVRRMEKIVERASTIEVWRQDPTAAVHGNASDVPEEDAVESQEEEQERRPLSVELASHQWVPPVLWSIYESVERARGTSTSTRRKQNGTQEIARPPVPREDLSAAMQQLMEQMRDCNPFSHLHVLYRPPPPVLPGDNSGNATAGKWVVRQSPSVWQIAESLGHYFRHMHDAAFWLESPRYDHESVEDCERAFTDIVSLVRNLSTHFHCVVLYLYSVAMGRADLNASRASIARQAATHSLENDLRDVYGLSPSLLGTSDSLMWQTYAYFPEVLVFLDEWRHEEANSCSSHAFGFANSEAVSEFAIDFSRRERKSQRTLVELATCLKDVVHAWWTSKLGTASFTQMQISEIGALELFVKRRLRWAMNLLYQQNVAAWVQRRQRADRHGNRFLEQLRIMTPKKKSVQVPPEGGKEQQQQQQSEKERPAAYSKPEGSSRGAEAHLPVEPRENKESKAVENGAEPPANQATVTEEKVEVAEMQSDNGELPAAQGEVGELGAIPAVMWRRKQHPANCGRFRAPGVLNLTEQCSATKSAKLKKSEHKSQEDKKSACGGSDGKRAKAVSDSKSQASKLKGEAKPVPLEPRDSRYFSIVQLKNIYAWTDEQIDAHEQEKEHIYELQQQLSVLRDRMSLESATQERLVACVARRLPSKTKATLALLEAWSRVRERALTAVCYSETIALHGAAEALIQRPSLRLDQDALRWDEKEFGDLNSTGARVTIVIDHSDDDGEGGGKEAPTVNTTDKHEPARVVDVEDELKTLCELKETIEESHHSIAEMNKRYNGEQTKEWLNHLVFFAQASKNLLEIAHERVLSPCSFEAEEAREIPCADSNAV